MFLHSQHRVGGADLPVLVPILRCVYLLPPSSGGLVSQRTWSYMSDLEGVTCSNLLNFTKKENEGPGEGCIQGHAAGGLWWTLSQVVCISFPWLL